MGLLIWYLNSGGRRAWTIVERPDEAERNQPRPDYVCVDGRGRYVTIEVTYIDAPPNHKAVEALADKLGYEVARRVAGQLNGTYVLRATSPPNLRHKPLSRAADEIARAIISLQAKMDVEQLTPLSFGMSLFKIRADGSELFPSVVLSGDIPSVNKVNSGQIADAFEAAVQEAGVKLKSYSRGDRLVLLVHDIYLDRVDYDEVLALHPNMKIESVQKCYALMDVIGILPRITRLW